MEKYIHFTNNFNTFEPTADKDIAPDISIAYGGLFVYKFPESAEDFQALWGSWGYRDAVEIWADDGAVLFNADSPSDEGDIFAEYIIPFSEINNIRCYRVDC